MRYSVRPMQSEDVSQITDIDREAFPSLWPSASYESELKHNPTTRYLVVREEGVEWPQPPVATPPVESGRVAPASALERLFSGVRRLFSPEKAPPAMGTEHIVGFAGLWFTLDEAHLTTVAVRQGYRRQGIGELLLISAIDLATARGARFVTLEVRASNLEAQALYRKYGFFKTGVRRGYYTDNREDAFIMTTDSIASASYQVEFQQLKRAHAARWGHGSGGQPHGQGNPGPPETA